MNSPATVAFIGTGLMGRHLAGHLQRAGYPLHIHSRTRAKAQVLLDAGAVWHDTAGGAAAAAEVTITMLGFPHDVEACYFGPEGIIARAPAGALLIDMTSSRPTLAQRIAAAAAARGLAALDAPVSGGDIGARDATLTIMAGGDAAAFARARPVLERLGRHIALLGGPGAGQHCKIANQIASALALVAWCEALAYARQAGLDPAAVQSCLSGGAADSWALRQLAPRALAGDFAPGGYAKHLLKDLALAHASARELKVGLPGLETAKGLYESVAARGWADCGTQVLFRLYAPAGLETTPPNPRHFP